MADDTIDLIRRFEPVLYFHKDERFFPSDAKRYLEHCALWDAKGPPFDDKAKWGGTSPRTFPHFPRIPRGKLVVLDGEPRWPWREASRGGSEALLLEGVLEIGRPLSNSWPEMAGT